MRVAVFHKPKDVRVETVPEPTLQCARDAIVGVTATAICGSDLHIYNGAIPQPRSMVLGHEHAGEAYDVFNKKNDGCVKVVLKPGNARCGL